MHTLATVPAQVGSHVALSCGRVATIVAAQHSKSQQSLRGSRRTDSESELAVRGSPWYWGASVSQRVFGGGAGLCLFAVYT